MGEELEYSVQWEVAGIPAASPDEAAAVARRMMLADDCPVTEIIVRRLDGQSRKLDWAKGRLKKLLEDNPRGMPAAPEAPAAIVTRFNTIQYQHGVYRLVEHLECSAGISDLSAVLAGVRKLFPYCLGKTWTLFGWVVPDGPAVPMAAPGTRAHEKALALLVAAPYIPAEVPDDIVVRSVDPEPRSGDMPPPRSMGSVWRRFTGTSSGLSSRR